MSSDRMMFADAPPAEQTWGPAWATVHLGGSFQASVWAKGTQRTACTKSAVQKHRSREHAARQATAPSLALLLAQEALRLIAPTQCKGVKFTQRACSVGLGN